MTEAHRSGCPINLPLELFGGKGGLLVLRNIILPSFSVTIRCAIVGSVSVASPPKPYCRP